MKKQLLVIAVVTVSLNAGVASAVDSSFVNALPIVDKAPSAQSATTASPAGGALNVLRDKWRQWSLALGTLVGAPSAETEAASCPYCPVPPCQ